jgi:hypothetical protein
LHLSTSTSKFIPIHQRPLPIPSFPGTLLRRLCPAPSLTPASSVLRSNSALSKVPNPNQRIAIVTTTTPLYPIIHYGVFPRKSRRAARRHEPQRRHVGARTANGQSRTPARRRPDDRKLISRQMQMGMESCLGKTVMAGVMGGGLGAMFGLFMASVSGYESDGMK